MAPFAAGQIVVVFRNRLRPEGVVEYGPRAEEIEALAHTMPGLVDVKSFVADDGERITISTFTDEEAVRAWRDDPEHRIAQAEGRSTFYETYTIQVCQTLRAGAFARP